MPNPFKRKVTEDSSRGKLSDNFINLPLMAQGSVHQSFLLASTNSNGRAETSATEKSGIDIIYHPANAIAEYVSNLINSLSVMVRGCS